MSSSEQRICEQGDARLWQAWAMCVALPVCAGRRIVLWAALADEADKMGILRCACTGLPWTVQACMAWSKFP